MDIFRKSQETLAFNFDRAGANSTPYFECSIGEIHCDTLENLEIHLVSCEIYENYVCEKRTRFLHEIKTRNENEHDSSKSLFHLERNRENLILVDLKTYKIEVTYFFLIQVQIQ